MPARPSNHSADFLNRRAASVRFEGMRLSEPTEPDLVPRCRAGDEAAWRELVARHTRKVFGVAYRFVGRVDEAEDLTQEIFVKVYQSLDRYRPGEGTFTTWLMTLARNHAIDDYRRRRQERSAPHGRPGGAGDVPVRRGQPAARASRSRIACGSCTAGLRALPPDLREPLILCDLKGLPYDEIASILDIPLGTVKSRINRGRLELAKRLLSARREVARP